MRANSLTRAKLSAETAAAKAPKRPLVAVNGHRFHRSLSSRGGDDTTPAAPF